MVFDGALADTKIGSDVLVPVACQNQFHDLMLSGGKLREMDLGGPAHAEMSQDRFIPFFGPHRGKGSFEQRNRLDSPVGRNLEVQLLAMLQLVLFHGGHSAAACSCEVNSTNGASFRICEVQDDEF